MAALLSIPLRTARTDDDSFSCFFSEPFKIKRHRIKSQLFNQSAFVSVSSKAFALFNLFFYLKTSNNNNWFI